MRRPIIVLLLIVLVVGVIIKQRDKDSGKTQVTDDAVQAVTGGLSSGEFELSVSTSDGSRPYILHVPESYEEGTPIPLVLFFHGGGGDMNQAKDYELQDTAEKYGFAVAFLNGASRFPQGRLATWNAGACCAYARDNDSDDVGYARAVVADIKNQLSVDENKVFATGMSNGGMMSYRLACEASDIFAAVAPVAGTDNTLSCNPENLVSVLHIHAEDDTHVLFEGGAGGEAFKDETMVTDFASVADSVSNWLAHNNITTPAKRTLSIDGAYCDTYERGDGAATVKLCVTETGEHSWPGSSVRDKVSSRAIDANEVIWEFFSTHGR